MYGSPMTTDLTAMLKTEVGHTQLSIKTSPTQGQTQKSQKGEGGYFQAIEVLFILLRILLKSYKISL